MFLNISRFEFIRSAFYLRCGYYACYLYTRKDVDVVLLFVLSCMHHWPWGFPRCYSNPFVKWPVYVDIIHNEEH
jgi:hypothetical protein